MGSERWDSSSQCTSIQTQCQLSQAGDFEDLPPICESTDVRAAVDVPACLESSQRARSQQIDLY